MPGDSRSANYDRLSENHENVRVLAEALSKLGFEMGSETVQTTIVFFKTAPFGDERPEEDRVRFGRTGRRVGMAIYYGITQGGIWLYIAEH